MPRCLFADAPGAPGGQARAREVQWEQCTIGGGGGERQRGREGVGQGLGASRWRSHFANRDPAGGGLEVQHRHGVAGMNLHAGSFGELGDLGGREADAVPEHQFSGGGRVAVGAGQGERATEFRAEGASVTGP